MSGTVVGGELTKEVSVVLYTLTIRKQRRHQAPATHRKANRFGEQYPPVIIIHMAHKYKDVVPIDIL